MRTSNGLFRLFFLACITYLTFKPALADGEPDVETFRIVTNLVDCVEQVEKTLFADMIQPTEGGALFIDTDGNGHEYRRASKIMQAGNVWMYELSGKINPEEPFCIPETPHIFMCISAVKPVYKNAQYIPTFGVTPGVFATIKSWWSQTIDAPDLKAKIIQEVMAEEGVECDEWLSYVVGSIDSRSVIRRIVLKHTFPVCYEIYFDTQKGSGGFFIDIASDTVICRGYRMSYDLRKNMDSLQQRRP